MPWGSRFLRVLFTGLFLASILYLPFTRPVSAARNAAHSAEVMLTFDVVEVKADESVTIRTRNFPVRTAFTVLMDVVGKQAKNGKPAGEFNSEKGGEMEFTYPIPDALKGKRILAIRVESKDGYLATNWFINEDLAYRSKDGKQKPELTFSSVKKNTSARVEGKNFPPNKTFSVRVGPFHTFYRDYQSLQSVKSDSSGNIRFDLDFTRVKKDAEAIMVRLDGAGVTASNNFLNTDGGRAVTAGELYKFQWCQVVAIRPVGELGKREEFDAVFTVQNTSNLEWKVGTVDFKFIGGEELHKYESIYDIDRTVPKGAVFDLAVDMVAPDDFAGWHSTTWALVRAGEEMCRMKISVFVKDN